MSIFKTTRLLALAALASFPLSGVAGDDFGLWTEISTEKKLTQQFSIDAGIDFRAEQQLKSVSRWAGSLGFSYKPAKFLKASAGYAYIYDRNPQESKKNYGSNSGRFNGYNVDHGFWRSKHRFYADLTGKLAIGQMNAVKLLELLPEICLKRVAISNVWPIGIFQVNELFDKERFNMIFRYNHLAPSCLPFGFF